MEVRIFDHYGMEEEPTTITGTPIEVEEKLRKRFHRMVTHIPFGDLWELVATLRRMSGIDIQISEEPPRVKVRRRPAMPKFVDAWPHEVDDDNL